MDNKLNLIVNFMGVDKMSNALKNIIGTGKTGGQVLKAMKAEARGLEQQLAKVRKEIASGTGNLTQLINRERELEKAVAGANAKLEKQGKLVAIDARTAAIGRRGEQLKQSGVDNIMGGAGMAAPIILAAKGAADFSSGMVDIQQKANLSNKATAILKNNIIAAAAAAKVMPEEMRAGVDKMLALGMTVEQAMAAAPNIGRLGTAFKVDIADGAATANANVNNLKIGLTELSYANDIMAASANQGGFEVRDMARHFPSLTAQMQALGAKGPAAVADLSAALQVAMRTAGDADEAGNNIKNLLAKINAPGTVNAFKKNFGIDLPAALKKLEDQGYTSMEAIAMITEKATGGDSRKLGFAFEDMQARQGLMAIMQNMDEYRRIRENALGGKGTIDKAFDQRVLNDANVSWRAFLGTGSRLAIVLGTTLLPVMTSMLGTLADMATGVSNWAQAHPQAAGFIIQAVGAIAAMRIGLGALQFAFGGIIGPMARIWGFMSKFDILGIASNAFKLLSSGAMMAGRAILFVGRAMLMNPIGLLVTGLAVGAYLIYTYWDQIKARFMQGVANLRSLFAPMAAIGKNIIMGLVNGLRSAGGAVWNTLKNIVMGGINGVKALLGIKSPSRVFMALGGFVSEGMALGIDKGGRKALGAAGRLATGVAGAGALALSPLAAAQAGGVGNDGRGPGAGADSYSFTINIYARDGQSAQDIADEVMKLIERKTSKSQRGAYYDG